ncbi:MAG: hypothetical protein H7Y38_01365, partial [Armatimonadetes bacterium]|nr:hypothetical protein [Armatimonadota bacterium]
MTTLNTFTKLFITSVALCFATGCTGVLPVAARQTVPPMRVAVFYEETFPTYGFLVRITPEQIAQDLRSAGIAADLLGVDALKDPSQFDAKRYAALVLSYGNTYPDEAFANLRNFHRRGGSFITTGVPFTHPVRRVAAPDGSNR